MSRPEQIPFDLGCRHAYGREDFWVSESNKDAVAWIDKWPHWPSPVLIIFGPLSCGKTHLLQVWKQETQAREVSLEDLNGLDADALFSKAIVIDDAFQAAGQEEAENTLFHLYNLASERGGHLLLAAQQPVKEWAIQLPDLKSRLMAAPAVAVHPPDDLLMAVVLTKLFSDRQIFVSQEVVQYTITRIDRSFLALKNAVDKIDRKALAEKRAVTIPLVREILA